MADLELPPADFESLDLPIVYRDAAKLLRLAWKDEHTHIGFRTDSNYRFDSPDASFGVLYAAFKLQTAFAESVLRDAPRKSGKNNHVPLEYEKLAARRVVELKGAAGASKLRLIPLYDNGLAAAHTDNRIAAIDNYKITQQWAKAFNGHPIGADGLIYMSRYTGAGKSVVLFNRCEAKIAKAKVTPLLAHPGFAKLSDDFKLSIELSKGAAAVRRIFEGL